GSAEPSAHDFLDGVAEFLGLLCGKLDDETAAAFERDPHDDTAPLLGHLERTVSRPRLHRRHACIPFLRRAAASRTCGPWPRVASASFDRWSIIPSSGREVVTISLQIGRTAQRRRPAKTLAAPPPAALLPAGAGSPKVAWEDLSATRKDDDV